MTRKEAETKDDDGVKEGSGASEQGEGKVTIAECPSEQPSQECSNVAKLLSTLRTQIGLCYRLRDWNRHN